MALIATPGSASADSYLTVAEADAIAADWLEDSETRAWLATTTTQDAREDALRTATSMIDAALRTRFPRYLVGQSLVYPASHHLDADSQPYLLPQLRQGVAAQARYLLANADVLSAARTRQARGQVQHNETTTSATEGASVVISDLARQLLVGLVITDRNRGVGSLSMSAGRIGVGYGW